MGRGALLLLVTLAGSFGQSAPAQPDRRILFIGNSLTTVNDLPGMVRTLASAADCRITTKAVAFNNFSLEDHWNQGEAVKTIAERLWSMVVLQQGPSSLPESQAQLREWTKRFDREVQKAGARTALYMVWPELARKNVFPNVSESYTNAAKDVNAVLFPVGDVWTAAWKRDPSLALYGPDNFHPSVMGTYLAALVMVREICGVSPVGLPAPGIEPATAKVLQEVAAAQRSGVPVPHSTRVRTSADNSP